MLETSVLGSTKGMKILVAVKRVVDYAVKIRVKIVDSTPDTQ